MIELEDYNDINLETLINLIYGGSILYIYLIGLVIYIILYYDC